MLTLLLIIGAIVLVVVSLRPILLRMGGPRIREVIESGDSQPLVEHLIGLPESAQLNALNDAIRQLWNAYERELALPLIRALAERFADDRISQYWLEQLKRVEPELAAQEEQLIAKYYRAEIAASCGSFG